GDHDVFELERGDRPRKIRRLSGVERQWPAVADIAERAAARTDVAHDHERRRALAKALADVRTRRFLAYAMQVVFAQDLLDFVEARRRRRAYPNPRRLLERLRRDHLNREFREHARGLRVALVLDAGAVRRCGWVESLHRQRLSKVKAIIGPSRSEERRVGKEWRARRGRDD